MTVDPKEVAQWLIDTFDDAVLNGVHGKQRIAEYLLDLHTKAQDPYQGWELTTFGWLCKTFNGKLCYILPWYQGGFCVRIDGQDLVDHRGRQFVFNLMSDAVAVMEEAVK